MGCDFKVKRVYAPPEADDGTRILVDRIWPRGLSKGEAALTLWLREVAPSAALRKRFGHDPARWAEFQRRYRAELDANKASVERLRDLLQTGRATLLYAARDEKHNNAVVLADYLNGEKHGAPR
jgi:uncharacterized protein YeaO (DUF488 family)